MHQLAFNCTKIVQLHNTYNGNYKELRLEAKMPELNHEIGAEKPIAWYT